MASRALLMKEGLGDRDPLSVFVAVSLFTLLTLLSVIPVLAVLAVLATATSVATSAALSATLASSATRPLASGGPSLTIARVLRILELLPQGVIHVGGVVALHPEVVPLEPAPVCGAIPSGLTR